MAVYITRWNLSSDPINFSISKPSPFTEMSNKLKWWLLFVSFSITFTTMWVIQFKLQNLNKQFISALLSVQFAFWIILIAPFYKDESILKDDKIGNKILWFSLNWHRPILIPYIPLHWFQFVLFNRLWTVCVDRSSIDLFSW